MKKLLIAFREASRHTKLFWIVSVGIGLFSTVLCLYPYFWLPEHRSNLSAEATLADPDDLIKEIEAKP